MTVEDSQEPFHCSHCENLGEISFSSIRRQKECTAVKILIKKLPKGINESGVKNLFLTVGKPLSINLNYESNSALVVLDSMNEAELAIRDLHYKPPYNLKVKLLTPRFKNVADNEKQEEKESEANKPWDFSHQEISVESEEDERSEKTGKVVNQVTNFIKNLGYNPSVRMRQKKLNFKTDSECVSLGRGYTFMGVRDRFVGGLQNFVCASENSTSKDKMKYYCQNCKAMSTKICVSCSAPFCSKICLNSNNVDHQKKCSFIRSNEVCQSIEYNDSNSYFIKQTSATLSTNNSFSKVPLRTGCTVIISSYFTMSTVFVRCLDEPWDENFIRLCNDVAVEAFKGKNLEEPPEEGDFVIAKYYEDLCFYRAKVCSNNKETITLVFIDFGNVQETKLEDIKPLSDRLKSVPLFAVEVHLKNVSEDSSLESVNYFNKLTAEKIPLILKFEDSTGEVVLTEKDSKVDVNETVIKYSLPSWKKDDFAFSKLGEIFYFNSITSQHLEIGRTCNLIISHFDEKEFLESEVFWVIDPETDDFFHANSEMYLRIKEYCEFLKEDWYLPRVNELCLAKENGEWHRCVNLKNHKTICCLFFIDDGHSSLIETNNIRKIIQDFVEIPSQAVCCTLPDNPKLKTNTEIQSKVVRYLKESEGQTLDCVSALKLMGDAYCLSIPEINKILS